MACGAKCAVPRISLLGSRARPYGKSVVERSAKRAGLATSRVSARSLRAGLATSAAKAGRAERCVTRQGRGASRTMVDRYVRDASLVTDNTSQGPGL